jgi:hypothetical protein
MTFYPTFIIAAAEIAELQKAGQLPTDDVKDSPPQAQQNDYVNLQA